MSLNYFQLPLVNIINYITDWNWSCIMLERWQTLWSLFHNALFTSCILVDYFGKWCISFIAFPVATNDVISLLLFFSVIRSFNSSSPRKTSTERISWLLSRNIGAQRDSIKHCMAEHLRLSIKAKNLQCFCCRCRCGMWQSWLFRH